MNIHDIDAEHIKYRSDYIYERLESLCADGEPAWLEAYAAMTHAFAVSSGRFNADELEQIARDPEMYEMLLPNNGMLITGMLGALGNHVTNACKQLAINELIVPVEYTDSELPAALTTIFKRMLSRDADKLLAKPEQTR